MQNIHFITIYSLHLFTKWVNTNDKNILTQYYANLTTWSCAQEYSFTFVFAARCHFQ